MDENLEDTRTIQDTCVHLEIGATITSTVDAWQHRHRAVTDKCSICGQMDSWRHSLLDGTMYRCVWALVEDHIILFICSIQEPGAKEWTFKVMEASSMKSLTRILFILWEF